MNTNLYFNPNILDEYFSDNRLAKINFIDMFEKSINMDTEKLILALKKQDAPKIAEAAHKLKSSFKYIDMKAMSEIFSQIETSSENEHVDYLNVFNLMKKAQHNYPKVFEELLACKSILLAIAS